MKTSYIAAILSLVLLISYFSVSNPSMSPQSNQKYVQIFENWKNEFQIKYMSQRQQIYRFGIFIENYQKIQQHNKNPLKSYEMGLNQFSATTAEEFISLLNFNLNRHITVEFQDQNNKNEKSNGQINWVTKGGVTSVKNMGQCASSTMFAVVASLQTYVFNQNHTLVPLSQQEMIDCCSDGKNPCAGGFVNFQALYQCVKKINITSADNYPYKGSQQKCDVSRIQQKSYPVKDKEIFSYKGCDVMSTKLQKGTISVIVDASNWMTYRSGVFSNCATGLNHAVTLVGQSNQFWTVKNQWGASWGQKGFIRLAKGNTCGVCSYGAMPI